MRSFINKFIKGDGVRARAVRSSVWVLVGFGGANVLRLVSNLVLTRLLFPEAFGLMALVQVFMVGLAMFSDLGVNVSIMQNQRGEEPDFLNTAWSIQILRGVLLWLGTCALAYPAAVIYNEPMLARLLPVVGLTAIIQGLTTTKAPLANRNLQIGKQTFTNLGTQAIGLIITALLAWLTGSVWALVAGGLISTSLRVIALHIVLKGPANRWHFDREMAWEIIHFGKYIFLGSIASFLINQSDRAILGGYITLTDLGIFTVGFTFANIPIELARVAGQKVILPLFRQFPPSESPENRAKVLKARRMILLATVAMGGVLSLISVPLVTILYDNRYHDAGPILTLLGFTVTALVATSNYEGAYLGRGDSKQHFRLTAIQAVIQVAVSFLLISRFGMLGAVFALGATTLLTYPFRAQVAHKYTAWDPKADLATLGLGWGCSALSMLLWQSDVLSLIAAS